jgi:hypothetical protein
MLLSVYTDGKVTLIIIYVRLKIIRRFREITSALLVCPLVRMEQLGFHWTECNDVLC